LRRLSEHFSLEEFTKSQSASRLRIDNTPPEDVIKNLTNLCIHVLEKVRLNYGRPVIVNSGYRSPALNKVIGGSRNSQHMSGQAADIEVPGIDNRFLFNWIKDNLQFDQLILEFYKPGIPDSGWVHVSWNSNTNRRQILEIK
jgi:zinc D-Ala-D-Ala carboxypeptidase